MKKLCLAIFASLFMFSGLHAEKPKEDQIKALKEWLHERIWEYETFKKDLTDSSDIYTYYMVYGKQSAYEEMLILLDKLEKQGVPQPEGSSESYQ